MSDAEVFGKPMTDEEVFGSQNAPATSIGAGASDIARGAAGVVGSVLDAPQNVLNLGKAAYGTAATAFGRPDLAPDIQPAQFGPLIQEGLSRVGIPENQPTNFWGQLIQRANQAVGGMMVGAGAVRVGIPNAVPSLSGEATSIAGQSLGGQAGHEMFPGSPTGEIAGSLLGGYRGSGTISNTRQVTELTRQKNLQTLNEAGVATPTASQVTQAPGYQWTEATLAKAPAGGYVMYKAAKDINAQMGEKVKGLADQVSSATSPEQAGRAVKTGIESFVDKFRGGWQAYDNEVAKHFAKDDPIQVTFTLRKLDDMINQGKGADKTLSALSGSERDALIQLRDSIQKDANQGTLPYEGFRAARSAAGKNSASTSLLSELPQSAYKAIYGAMSDDLTAAAITKDFLAGHSGSATGAERAIDNQNKYWQAGRKRIDNVLDPLMRDTPEAIYTAATSGSDKGATKLWALRRSLPDKDWSDFSAVFVDRMGKAKPNAPDDLGANWSAQRFLNDYNNLSPNSRKALFGSPVTPGLEANLRTVAEAADLVTKGGKQYANPSGTAQAVVSVAAATEAGSALVRGSMWELAGVAAVVGGGAGTAVLMTHAPFVKWLAESTKISPEKLPLYAARLTPIAAKINDEESRKQILQLQSRIQSRPVREPAVGGIRG